MHSPFFSPSLLSREGVGGELAHPLLDITSWNIYIHNSWFTAHGSGKWDPPEGRKRIERKYN